MATEQCTRKVVIMGAAGRDFHDFNVAYRDDPAFQVVAFTAAQIPDISGRRYPPALAGPNYPDGIAIVDEADLPRLCRENEVDEVVFAYSDIAHVEVMHRASIALAAGSSFSLLGPRETMLPSRLPVIAVTAVRTGCGKSQVTRWLSRRLRRHGLSAAVVRHPMPYGDLERQAVQRFADLEDLALAECTVEEREEYEPHIAVGNVVFAGVDYGAILREAEREADVILWDGGNNDFSFYVPDLDIALVDALRPGHETLYHPGEAVLRMADMVIVAKADAAQAEDVTRVTEAAKAVNPNASIVCGGSPVRLEDAESVKGRRVLVIEDGPTITHGGMAYGAGHRAAHAAGAGEIVDARPFAKGEIAGVFRKYPHIGNVLPAMGYGAEQLADLEATINAVDADAVVQATPADLTRLIKIDHPVVKAAYEFEDMNGGLEKAVGAFLKERGLIANA